MVASSVDRPPPTTDRIGVYTVTNCDGNQEQFTTGHNDEPSTTAGRAAPGHPQRRLVEHGRTCLAGHGLDVGHEPKRPTEVW